MKVFEELAIKEKQNLINKCKEMTRCNLRDSTEHRRALLQLLHDISEFDETEDIVDHLSVLDLHDLLLTHNELKVLSLVLCMCKHLDDLNLQNCNLKQGQVKTLAKDMDTCDVEIEHFNIKGNKQLNVEDICAAIRLHSHKVANLEYDFVGNKEDIEIIKKLKREVCRNQDSSMQDNKMSKARKRLQRENRFQRKLKKPGSRSTKSTHLYHSGFLSGTIRQTSERSGVDAEKMGSGNETEEKETYQLLQSSSQADMLHISHQSEQKAEKTFHSEGSIQNSKMTLGTEDPMKYRKKKYRPSSLKEHMKYKKMKKSQDKLGVINEDEEFHTSLPKASLKIAMLKYEAEHFSLFSKKGQYSKLKRHISGTRSEIPKQSKGDSGYSSQMRTASQQYKSATVCTVLSAASTSSCYDKQENPDYSEIFLCQQRFEMTVLGLSICNKKNVVKKWMDTSDFSITGHNIKTEGYELKIDGCTVIFPKGCFSEITRVWVSIEANCSKLPDEYIAIAPTFDMECESTLMKPVHITLPSWCIADGSSHTTIYEVLHYQEHKKEWETIRTFQLTRERIISFSCQSFSPITPAIKQEDVGPQKYYLSGCIYTNRNGVHFAFFFSHLNKQKKIDESKPPIAELVEKFDLILVEHPDKITVSIEYHSENMNSVYKSTQFSIDEELLHCGYKRVVISLEDQCIARFKCCIMKNDVILESHNRYCYYDFREYNTEFVRAPTNRASTSNPQSGLHHGDVTGTVVHYSEGDMQFSHCSFAQKQASVSSDKKEESHTSDTGNDAATTSSRGQGTINTVIAVTGGNMKNVNIEECAIATGPGSTASYVERDVVKEIPIRKSTSDKALSPEEISDNENSTLSVDSQNLQKHIRVQIPEPTEQDGDPENVNDDDHPETSTFQKEIATVEEQDTTSYEVCCSSSESLISREGRTNEDSGADQTEDDTDDTCCCAPILSISASSVRQALCCLGRHQNDDEATLLEDPES